MPTTTIQSKFSVTWSHSFPNHEFFLLFTKKICIKYFSNLLKSLVNLVFHGESELYDQPFIFDESFHQSMSTLIF